MKYVTLPNTDLKVSNISLGTAALGTIVNADNSFAILNTYCEAGGNFIDTAHVYADWHGGERHMSEKTIRKWRDKFGPREQLVLATKGGHPDLATPLTPRLAPSQIIDDLNESLDCLGVEQVDLYWLHRDDPERPVAELVETMNDQLHSGKVRYFGCSNWRPERIRAAHEYATAHGLYSFAASQIHWSLAVPNPGAFASDHALMDNGSLNFYSTAEMGVVCYTSQARGFFNKAATGKVDALNPVLRHDFENAETLARLARAQTLASHLGTSVSTIVRAFITSQPFVAIPIIGPVSIAQLDDSLTDAALTLAPEMLRFLTTGEPANEF